VRDARRTRGGKARSEERDQAVILELKGLERKPLWTFDELRRAERRTERWTA